MTYREKYMNILLTSAGRRGYMVNYFKEALGKGGKVYVGNCDENAASFLHADKTVITPLIYDANYIEFLIKYCNQEKISAIVPLFDIDLYILSQNKDLFKSNEIDVVVSDSSIIEICNDKWKMKEFLEKNYVLTPKTYLLIEDAVSAVEAEKAVFPLVIKPRWGMGSIGVYEADNLEELKVLYFKARQQIKNSYLKYESEQDLEKSVLIQEKICGQEYGVDIINNLAREYQSTIVKKKCAMRAGETDIAITVENDIIENLGSNLGTDLGHVGNLDVDVILTKENIPYVIDMNARFGGGYPFSHCAGVDLPRAIIMWLNGERVEKERLLTARKNIKVFKEIALANFKYMICP